MPGAGWLPFRRKTGVAPTVRGEITRAALRESSLPSLVEFGTRTLMQAVGADRAAVWVAGSGASRVFSGSVAGSSDEPQPEGWERLDVSAGFFGDLLVRQEPLVMDLEKSPLVPMIGPLLGMRRAAWMPLRAGSRVLGLAMAAYHSLQPPVPTGLLGDLGNELALAVMARREEDLRMRREEDLAARGALLREILLQTSSGSILERIAAEAWRYTGAGFVAFGRRDATPLGFEALQGPEPWEVWAHGKTVAEACRTAMDEMRLVVSEFGRASNRTADGSTAAHLVRVVAVPLVAGGRSLGVLLAGFSAGEERNAGLEALQAYAALAALALERESRPEHDAGNRETGAPEAELRAVLEAVESGVVLYDAEGRVRFANERLAQLLGLNGERIAPRAAREAVVKMMANHFRNPQAFVERSEELFRRREEAGWEELEFVRPTRKMIERQVRAVRDAGGGFRGWLEIYRDISGQRLMHSKLLRTEKMAAIGQLVSGIAHELNNPLTSIMGYAQLLLGRRLASEPGDDARKIYQEADRASRIVKNLLLFTRDTKPERRAVSLNEIVERTVALRSYELKVENIAVELVLDPNLPPTLADASQMQQVLLNLLVNAEQALQQSRGRGRICIRTQRAGTDRLALEVSDDGPGIPAETASRIFDPFFTTKPIGVGTGLGLSIVYGIVREHGGEITVESKPGEGATFQVELPILALPVAEGSEEVAPALPAPSEVSPGGTPSHGPQRVLVVEDEPTVAQLIADVLREEGHRVDAVVDSREAMERVRRQEYDLLVLDLRMPVVDGRTFYGALVRDGNPLQHRIVFVTGDTLAPHTLEFLDSTGLPYLAKPFLIEELKLAVQRALSDLPAARVAYGASSRSSRTP